MRTVLAVLSLTLNVAAQASFGPIVLPASRRTAMGNSNNTWGVGYANMRYQQLCDGGDVGPAQTFYGHALRARNASQIGGQQALEIRVSVSKNSPLTMSSVYADNIGGPPATVFRGTYNYPSLASNTDPTKFEIVFPWSRSWLWSGNANEHFLIEIYNASTQHLLYFTDAHSGDPGVSRLYNTTAGIGATTGTVQPSYGLVMCLHQDPVPPFATYEEFDRGCTGTGGKVGVVLPAGARATMGNTANYFGIGYANQRYQQVFDALQVGPARSFVSHAYRMRDASIPGGRQILEIRVSNSANSPITASTSFAANIDGAQTTVFRGQFDYPPMVSNTNPASFEIIVPWATPWTWTAAAGKHLLLEIHNASVSSLAYHVDAWSGDFGTARIYGDLGGLTGTKQSNYGLVVCFGYGDGGPAVPVLGHSGVPRTASSMQVTLAKAKQGSVAALVMGLSRTKWGPLPLPLDLGPFGAKDCRLLASMDFMFPMATDARGEALFSYLVPDAKGLWGVAFYNQWFVLDLAANGLGLVFTNGGAASIGGL